MSKPLKVSLYVLGTIVVLAIIAIAIAYFYPQLYIMVAARIEFPIAKYPGLYTMPVHRDLQPLAVNNPQEIKYSNFTFDVPWSQEPTIQSSKTDEPMRFMFGKENVIVIADITGTDLRSLVIDELEKSHPGQYNDVSFINFMFGDKLDSTQYDLFSYMLNVTPYSISLSDSKSEAIGKMMMLVYKGVVSLGDNKIYSFETPYLKGFQNGDPSPSSSFNVFDNHGRFYSLFIRGTQAEIDYILSSIRPTE